MLSRDYDSRLRAQVLLRARCVSVTGSYLTLPLWVRLGHIAVGTIPSLCRRTQTKGGYRAARGTHLSLIAPYCQHPQAACRHRSRHQKKGTSMAQSGLNSIRGSGSGIITQQSLNGINSSHFNVTPLDMREYVLLALRKLVISLSKRCYETA